jgi:ribosomal protein S12 methylthiotransferase
MDGQVPEDVKLEREQRVRDLADECGFASAAQRIGGTYRVLVDAVEDDGDGNVELVGRAAFQSPDSDGVVHLGDLDAAMGDFVEVRIDDAACYELFAVAD